MRKHRPLLGTFQVTRDSSNYRTNRTHLWQHPFYPGIAKFHFVVELGFDGYIEKPVTQSKLIPVLEKLLQGGNNETKNI